MVVVGSIVGKKISYRMVNLLAMILCVLGGLVPFFYAPNWPFVLVMRAILGIGVGFYSIRNPLFVKTVPCVTAYSVWVQRWRTPSWVDV